MTAPLLDDYRWLASASGEPWLARAAAHEGELASLARLLRKDLTAERAHLVLEQMELRRRAKNKFTASGTMLFTRTGLEQATGEIPAAHKAARFAANGRAADLCCGIGGDLISLAARGPTEGFDRDPLAAFLAEHNCRVSGTGNASVRATDVAAARVADFDAWHIDPDRRPAGRRTTRVELGEPGIECIDGLLAQNESACVKLAPAAIAPEHWAARGELEWLGERGECRQQVVWLGSLARHIGRRAATVLSANGASRSVVGTGNEEIPIAPAVGRFVYEPDSAVLAARLAGVLAAEHQLTAIAAFGGYLSGDRMVNDAALAPFEVLDSLPFDLRKLKAWLRERCIGRIEVKKRGVDVDPAELLRKLKQPGDEIVTLLLTRLGKQTVAILARRL